MTGEQPRNPDRGKVTHGQPPQFEGDAGATKYGPEQTEVGLIDRELPSVLSELLSPTWSELGELKTQLINNLRNIIEKYLRSPDITDRSYKVLEKELVDRGLFLDIVDSIRAKRTQEAQGTEGTERLETITDIAFRYMRLLRKDDDRYQQLAGPVVEIANKLQQAVYKIELRQELPFETKEEFLKGLILHMVELILSINKISSYDSRFRGKEYRKEDIYHPNNAFLKALYTAASALVDQAAEVNQQASINAISSLLEMTKELWPDELESIHNKILLRILAMIENSVMENGKIDDNLKEQIADWFIKYFSRSTDKIKQFVSQLLRRVPSDLGLLETLSQKLNQLARENKNDDYWYKNIYLHECFYGKVTEMEALEWKVNMKRGIRELRKEIEALRKEIEALREENKGLRTQDQRLKELRRLLNQTGTDKEK